MNQAIPPEPGQPGSDAAAPAQRIASLEAENQALRARMAFLLEQVERNHDIMCRHQAFDLEIVSASTFPELIGTIFRTLPVISDLDGVTLSLLDEDDDIVLVMEKLGVDFSAFPQLLFVHEVAELGFAAPKPVAEGEASLPPLPLLGAFDAAVHGARFPASATVSELVLRSVALVPLLRNKRLIGSLNLASSDVTRFTPSLGTDFIKHMASIIAICLENVISNEMLKYIGAEYIIIGHSERRTYHKESDEFIAKKFAVLKEQGLIPVLCIGETEAENEAGKTEEVCARQIDAVLKTQGAAAFEGVVIAYEPVWAIGTGKSATPAQAQAVHKFIRDHIAKADAKIAEQVIIQYGGSVNAGNAAELFTQPDIDGALVGGASLKADAFAVIVKAAEAAKKA